MGNTSGATSHQNQVEGGVAMLILLEILLEHGQGFFLWFAFVFEPFFLEQMSKRLGERRKRLEKTRQHQVVDPMTTYIGRKQLLTAISGSKHRLSILTQSPRTRSFHDRSFGLHAGPLTPASSSKSSESQQ